MIHESVGFADPSFLPGCAMRLPGPFSSSGNPNDEKGATGMKKPSSKIREEIGRLQEQLKQAETREAERIGRLALKAGLGEIEIEDGELVTALEEVVARFRKGSSRTVRQTAAAVPPGAPSGSGVEA
jgi:hypothetical protein